ncbi:BatA domain-containing protein [Flavobacterium sp. CS20]|uniref:BatA domain-containing protein n=1 Tax=Flavobacterium sp. CS20 TaxID=2775246 RepID=UPI001B3A3345|nr:BatA domain-containing protein [Flavobacterium sp. CS20]QTY27944.1 BatA domain-containing protein [Flavobacterium sp. CS20]
MQFYRPELLYGLLALAIPIIVHLFQLRKFKTEPFTNVALLKKLIISSRKSSKLKKWLSLIARLLIITCLVLAFAQPYFSDSKIVDQKKQIGVFIDNSYSMALKGQNTSLFEKAKKELLEALPENENYHIATHDQSLKNVKPSEFKSWLYDLDYSSVSLDLKAIFTKAQSLYQAQENQLNELVILSDFQYFEEFDSSSLDTTYNYHFIQYQPKEQINFSIDTAYLKTSAEQKTLMFKVSASDQTTQSLPVSLYDDKTLLGKFSLNFEDETEKNYSFDIEQNEIINGRIQIDDASLSFDNKLFFSIAEPEKIKVLIISQQATSYLDKVYNNERFDYQQSLIGNLEYADISQADVVILNELQSIPNALKISIENHIAENKVLGIIPSKDIDLNSYNDLFNALNLRPYSAVNSNEIKLTTIAFEHPIFEDVFTQRIQNFDYPSFESYYRSSNPQKALAFSNGLAFLESQNNIFRFNATIEDNSNFKQSPLVVLSFYNLALQAQTKTQLYAEIGQSYQFNIKTQLNPDEVLSLSQDEYKFIPKQNAKGQHITLQFDENLNTPGHYAITNTQNDTLYQLAFNLNRKENQFNYLDVSNFNNVKTYDSFTTYAQNWSESQNQKSLWQWFIAFALIFMIIELLLLRFIK